MLYHLGRTARSTPFTTRGHALSSPPFQRRAGVSSYLTSRHFTATPPHRKEEPRVRTLHQEKRKDAQKESVTRKPEDADGIRPETIQKPRPNDPPSSGQQEPLLGEQTVSNKEQRRADWAIIKEMSKYLWPKDNLGTRFRVGASVGLLVGAKVNGMASPAATQQNHRLRDVYRSSMSKCLSTSKASWTP